MPRHYVPRNDDSHNPFVIIEFLDRALDKGIAEIETSATGLRETLFAADMERFAYSLEILFAGIPYVMHKEQESYYHSLLHVVCAILGSDVSSEGMTSVGHFDLVVILPEVIFVIELKLDKAAQ